MVLKNAYVIARNAAGRPTLQHRLLDGGTILTACGKEMTGWSRAYQAEAIPALLCRLSGCRA